MKEDKLIIILTNSWSIQSLKLSQYSEEWENNWICHSKVNWFSFLLFLQYINAYNYCLHLSTKLCNDNVCMSSLIMIITNSLRLPLPLPPGVYLPLLWEQSFCWKSPIALGYTRGHFSALVAMENDGFDNRGAGANLNTDDDVTVTFLPLVDSERKLLHIHFLSAQEVRTSPTVFLFNLWLMFWFFFVTGMFTLQGVSPLCQHWFRRHRASYPEFRLVIRLHLMAIFVSPPPSVLQMGNEEQQEKLLREWLDCCVTEGGVLVALQKSSRRRNHPLVTQMVEKWLDGYRQIRPCASLSDGEEEEDDDDEWQNWSGGRGRTPPSSLLQFLFFFFFLFPFLTWTNCESLQERTGNYKPLPPLTFHLGQKTLLLF